MSKPQAPPQAQARASELEVISQQVEEDNQCQNPVQLGSFAYRDLPLAALDISLAGSQLISNLDEEDNREGSNWLKPCCGRRAAPWQVCLLSAGFNCFVVACVILVVVLLCLELLIDTKLLQFNNALLFASIIHWISLVILSVFFAETVFRIVVLGIWDYIENKVEVFDGAVIVLSLAPMVASTVANGPSSPWDAIGLIITLRIWRIKRIIDAYVLQVKVEMEMEIQQYEKAKAVREEQLERLTQICQEQAFEIRQLRAHLAQQDLDLVAEREAAMQIHHVWGKQSSIFQEVDGLAPTGPEQRSQAKAREAAGHRDHVVQDDMNNYISQYYSEASSDIGIPDPARVITTAIDIHLPNNPSQQPSSLVSADAASSRLQPTGGSVSEASNATMSHSSFSARQHSISSHTLGSTTDCSSTVREASTSTDSYSGQRCYPPPYCSPLALGTQPGARGHPSAVVQELLSSLSEDSCLGQKGLDPVNLKLPSPAGSTKTSPELEHRLNIYNKRNQESRGGFHTKPLIHLQASEPFMEEKYRLSQADAPVNRLPET
ncbi:transmembrane protein 266-like isoform X1 [Oncorhynchus tshawytscha]|uniref:Transmembrane protein 266 n=1 Tax=Oncorhynchus tshawytscha TaxID=74940 RepID=A0A8C8JFQ3_ONCTS|nr:transmembrane protein 266-like isoform X1 [Oncorhynchus tshawytscha]XP_042179104.1 transmembrane protein 266-like isoform X1 [Oncorhynchus tshawytscha]XP_042179105.1 transmembrane protein 266-like isoform X1 [Oncorhynchus tshawytscha]